MCYAFHTAYTIKHVLIECIDLGPNKKNILQAVWKNYLKKSKHMEKI